MDLPPTPQSRTNAAGFPLRWFLGIPFTPMPLEEAARQIATRDPAAPFGFVVTPNAQHVVAVWNGSRVHLESDEKAWMVLNDSRILGSLAGKLFGEPMALAAGSDLTVYLFHHCIHPDDPITIIGGTDEVERRLVEQFKLRNVARYDPPMGFARDPVEVQRCIDFVVDHPARYIFLAVGAPQSEVMAMRLKAEGRATGIGLCIGSALNFVTGVVRRAPVIMQRLHLEALWRLMLNPRRHFRRVFVESLPVLWIAFRVWLRPKDQRDHHRVGFQRIEP